ncbi:MAG: hypothetical protein V1664_05165 [Candidatus Uhrbacteria bacterium]
MEGKSELPHGSTEPKQETGVERNREIERFFLRLLLAVEREIMERKERFSIKKGHWEYARLEEQGKLEERRLENFCRSANKLAGIAIGADYFDEVETAFLINRGLLMPYITTEDINFFRKILDASKRYDDVPNLSGRHLFYRTLRVAVATTRDPDFKPKTDSPPEDFAFDLDREALEGKAAFLRRKIQKENAEVKEIRERVFEEVNTEAEKVFNFWPRFKNEILVILSKLQMDRDNLVGFWERLQNILVPAEGALQEAHRNFIETFKSMIEAWMRRELELIADERDLRETELNLEPPVSSEATPGEVETISRETHKKEED